MPELTAREVRASFPKGTAAVRVRETLGPLSEGASFAEAFPARGRPAVPPGALALVPVLQSAEGLSGRQAAGQVRARADWNFLPGPELDGPGFGFTVLGGFRARLAGNGSEERVPSWSWSGSPGPGCCGQAAASGRAPPMCWPR
ncbi:transposase [Streptomyces virginiae]